jgi:hypothetical protein
VVFYISIDLLFLYVNLCKKMYMKKVYIVTPENLQEILKSLKEALETQTLIFERRIYTESSIQANEWLHLYPTNNFVPDPENEDECLMSISSEKRLTSDSINIEEDDDKNQFIAIRDFPTKTGYLINIGDKVTIVDNKIVFYISFLSSSIAFFAILSKVSSAYQYVFRSRNLRYAKSTVLTPFPFQFDHIPLAFPLEFQLFPFRLMFQSQSFFQVMHQTSFTCQIHNQMLVLPFGIVGCFSTNGCNNQTSWFSISH